MFRFPMMDRMDRSWEIFWRLGSKKEKVPDLELLRILEDLQQIVESTSWMIYSIKRCVVLGFWWGFHTWITNLTLLHPNQRLSSPHTGFPLRHDFGEAIHDIGYAGYPVMRFFPYACDGGWACGKKCPGVNFRSDPLVFLPVIYITNHWCV